MNVPTSLGRKRTAESVLNEIAGREAKAKCLEGVGSLREILSAPPLKMEPIVDTEETIDERNSPPSTNIPHNLFSGGPLSDETVVFEVYGRMSILSSVQKYKVTVAELKRRILEEKFTTSLLGCILRRAKNKKSGSDLREFVIKLGMTPNPGRHALPITLFSSLTEGESLSLAKDFTDLCVEFPSKEIFSFLLNKRKTESDRYKFIEDLKISSSILHEFLEVSLIGITEEKCDELPMDVNEGFRVFSLLSHRFGPYGIVGGLGVFQRFVNSVPSSYVSKPQPMTEKKGNQVNRQGELFGDGKGKENEKQMEKATPTMSAADCPMDAQFRKELIGLIENNPALSINQLITLLTAIKGFSQISRPVT